MCDFLDLELSIYDFIENRKPKTFSDLEELKSKMEDYFNCAFQTYSDEHFDGECI